MMKNAIAPNSKITSNTTIIITTLIGAQTLTYSDQDIFNHLETNYYNIYDPESSNYHKMLIINQL